jgi:hypothetical protein
MDFVAIGAIALKLRHRFRFCDLKLNLLRSQNRDYPKFTMLIMDSFQCQTAFVTDSGSVLQQWKMKSKLIL